MVTVRVDIVRITDDSFPVFVEAVLVDCHGEKHYFHDKLPVFALDFNTEFPAVGGMRCQIVETKQETIIIDISLPDNIESTAGAHRFEVWKSEIKRP